MPLTPAQKATVKADILADGELNSKPNNTDGNSAISDLYKVIVSPDYWVWRTQIPKDEITQKVSQDGTSFIWAGNGFISRTVTEIACWSELFASGSCNASLPNVRQAFNDIFNGAGNAALNRTHLLAVGRRKSNRLEKLLATGAGTSANPSLMGYEGSLSPGEIEEIRS